MSSRQPITLICSVLCWYWIHRVVYFQFPNSPWVRTRPLLRLVGSIQLRKIDTRRANFTKYHNVCSHMTESLGPLSLLSRKGATQSVILCRTLTYFQNPFCTKHSKNCKKVTKDLTISWRCICITSLNFICHLLTCSCDPVWEGNINVIQSTPA